MDRRTLALAVGTLLTASAVAQPPAGHTPSRSRKFTLPIEFDAAKRKTIEQVQLLVSRDQGQTWEVHDAIAPDKDRTDKDYFNLATKEDGTYWLSMLIRHKDGTSDPPDPYKPPADRVLKYLIDATLPVVLLTDARRDGDDVLLEWSVEDKYPNDPATTISYKTASPGAVGDWLPVPTDAVAKRTARFKPAVAGPITVRVSVLDSAGNPGQVMKELPGGTTTAYTPQVVVPVAANQASGLGAPQLPAPVLPGGPAAPPSLPAAGPNMPAAVAAPVTPVITPPALAPAPLPPTVPVSTPLAPSPAPMWAPTNPATAAEPGPSPIATSGGTTPAFSPAPPPAAPPEAAVPVQHVRFTQFQLQYQLDAGPSGVRQIDLYVTRDDGRTWTRWSQHDGKENPLRVNLSRTTGPADGDYGFKLVSVSNANLSDDIPAPGTPPDVRVRVDTTPPLISVYPIEADPANRGAVLIKWKATDLNLTESSPVGIEWSDTPTGNWRPVGGSEVGAVNLNPSAVGRVPNRGSYSWQLPPNLPSHLIYFRFTAADPAGNRSEVVAPPQTVDLVRPRARIQGVVTASAPR